MPLDLDAITITAEEKQQIKDKSPEVLPLNPTSQGWTGQQVRRQLSRYVTDEQQSVLALMSEKFDVVSSQMGTLENLVQGGLDVLQVVYDETIAAGDLLQFAGTVGGSGKLKVKKTRNSGEDSIQTHPEYIVGIALESGTQNQTKEIMTNGIYIGLDTSDYTEGAILYADPSVNGGLTNTQPTPPQNRSKLAVTIYSHQNNGIIIFRPSFDPDMSHIQDVDLTGLQNGYVLKYDSTNKVFKPGLSQGIFYDDDVPDIEDRYPNLTWFNESEE